MWYSVGIMKILILTVFLAVVQTAPPIPRQTTNGTTGASGKIQKKGQNNQAPTAPFSPTLNTTNAPTADNKTQNQSADNTEHSIVISKPVPVSVHRDWLDWGIWVFDILLVGVGFLQWQVLKRQAGLMKTHADHLSHLATAADANAQAAQKSADLAVKSNRPFLIVEIRRSNNHPDRDFLIFAINLGKTAARLREGKCGNGPYPVTNFIPTDTVMGPFVAPLQELTLPQKDFEIDKINIQTYDFNRIEIPPKVIYTFGYLEYWDTFTDRTNVKPYRVQWCYNYSPSRRDWLRSPNGYSQTE